MPTTTGTQNLTIPASTDNIEDQWFYHATMAGQMESRFNLHDADAARLNPRPFAVVDCTVQASYPAPSADSNQYHTMIMFDTVMVDTDNMTDLEVMPWGIILPETGMYHFSAYAKVLPSGCTGPGMVTASVSARGTGSVQSIPSGTQSTELGITGNTSVNMAGDIIVNKVGSAFGHIIIGFLGSACAQTFTTVYARLGVYKVRDL